MTRFPPCLDDAVATVFAAVAEAKRGQTSIPVCPSARAVDLAAALIGNRSIETKIAGIRPGEKIHEILISEEELFLTVRRGRYHGILPEQPEIRGDSKQAQHSDAAYLDGEYSSGKSPLTVAEVVEALHRRKLVLDKLDQVATDGQELLA